MPKCPPTSFFLFWRRIKKSYLDKVIELKTEYEKAMENYKAGEDDDQPESVKEIPAKEVEEELIDEE
ncbi:high mobility group B protein 7 isoform X2 [Spatholobus suberectus]|nr:high mobility group B protein 7 isoform X2 [Spatholobus suberectus]